jgi:hypothetical protein
MDIAPAYPGTARVEQWRRTVTLDRRREVVELHEAYALEAFVEPLRLNFMTPLVVDTSRRGEVRLRPAPGTDDRAYTLAYDPARFDANSEEITVGDSRLRGVWGDRVFRIVLVAKSRELRGDYRITVHGGP